MRRTRPFQSDHRLTRPGPRRRQFGCQLALIALVCGLGGASNLYAATLDVCPSGCDFTTIADAVAAADNFDHILVDVALPAVHTEQGIVITQKILTIEGLGRDRTVLQAAATTDAATSQVMAIFTSASVTVRDLTIRHGNTAFDGGAIAVSGTKGLTSDLVVRRVRFHDNRAARSGGAINASTGSTLVVEDSIFEDNEAAESGGAVRSSEDLILRRSLVRGNTADFGGGVSLAGDSRVSDSTFFGNEATTNGGGLVASSATLVHVTVVGNIAPSGETAGILGFAANLNNTVAALNGHGDDCDIGGLGVAQGNWDSDGTCPGTEGTGDPMLGALRDNGGPTDTMAPMEVSPLINQGELSVCTPQDQRGQLRSLEGAPCDIGAYERFGLSVCVQQDEPLAIPDNDAVGVTETVTLGSPGDDHRIVDVDAKVDLVHPWVGDLVVEVEHLGLTRRLLDRPGVPASTFGCDGDDVSVTFDSDAATEVEDQCSGSPPAVAGRHRPNQALGAYDGLTGEGDWVFRVADEFVGETGFALNFCIAVDLFDAPGATPIFIDGFESGDTSAWDG